MTEKNPIEVDVTQVNKTWLSHRTKDNIKHYVVGMFQRGGKAIIVAIPDNDPETVSAVVLKHVARGSTIYSEENVLPKELSEYYNIQSFVISDSGRAGSDVHINNVNNLWKDLKRRIKRTHVTVSQKHIQLYCNEVSYMANTRHMTASERFSDMLIRACNTLPND